MEEKINNKRIFSYVPSIIARIILDSELKDEDVFFNKNRKNRKGSTLLSPSTNNSKFNWCTRPKLNNLHKLCPIS